MGIDSDHELAEGEVGVVGVAIDTLKDMEILLMVFLWIRSQHHSRLMPLRNFAYYVYRRRRETRRFNRENWGTIQNDILKEYVSRGRGFFQ
jgi:methylmalonyl-CoA mutase N-terminal domain/subunit